MTAVYVDTALTPGLHHVARRQRAVVRRDQLPHLGVSRDAVQAQLDARRWRTWGPNVILLGNGEPDRFQQIWAAYLDGGRDARIVAHTGLEMSGFVSFAAEAADIHVAVPRGARYSDLPNVVVHESRRLARMETVFDRGIRRTSNAQSALDAAAWQPLPRFACALVAAAVQQKLCTAEELDRVMAAVGRVRHKAHLRLAIKDIGDGAESIGEIDVARMCRRFGMPLPRRQVRRRDSAGRWRYLDCEWDLPDGTIVVLEVDGRHHLDVQNWDADAKRERSVVVSRRWVLRATTIEMRVEPEAVAADLAAMGVPAPRLVRLRAGSHPVTA